MRVCVCARVSMHSHVHMWLRVCARRARVCVRARARACGRGCVPKLGVQSQGPEVCMPLAAENWLPGWQLLSKGLPDAPVNHNELSDYSCPCDTQEVSNAPVGAGGSVSNL